MFGVQGIRFWLRVRTRAARARSCGLLSGLAPEAADVGGLRDGLSGHRFEQIVATGSGGKIEVRVERVEFEDVVVISRTRRCSWSHVSGLVRDVVPLDRAFRQFAFGNSTG